MTEEQPEPFEAPANIVIDNLRQEVARINDDRISLLSQLDYARQVIKALSTKVDAAATPDDDAE